MGERTVVRALAWFAIAAQPLFIATWVIAGGLEPGYSHVVEHISELGAEDAAHAWIVNAGLAVLGLAAVALAVAVERTLPRQRASRVAAILFALFGAAIVAAAILPVDCAQSADARCAAAEEAGDLSGNHYAHLWLGLAAEVLILATPFALARAFADREAGPAALAAGLFGLAFFVAVTIVHLVGGEPDPGTGLGGLIQRAGFLLLQAWLLIVAIGVLHATRSPAPPPEPTPIRPRDFFGRSWSGSGEAYLRPTFLWRRFGSRFRVQREVSWLCDEAFVVDDQARFESGRVERRRLFGRFETPERITIISGVLPDGAELEIEPGGYRIPPYRALARLGPLLIPVACHEHHRIEDGELIDTIDIHLLGVPALRFVIQANIESDERPQPVAAAAEVR